MNKNVSTFKINLNIGTIISNLNLIYIKYFDKGNLHAHELISLRKHDLMQKNFNGRKYPKRAPRQYRWCQVIYRPVETLPDFGCSEQEKTRSTDQKIKKF